MLVELAIGDAYGATFEFQDVPYVQMFNRLVDYGPSRHRRHRVGRYTDDTQMSIAITEALLADDPWTPLALADRFVRSYKRDPRGGYARGFRRLLESVADGEEFLERIRPMSERNGAAMRAGPIGVLAEIDDVLAHAEIQARITHDTEPGVVAAQAAALMTHYFVHRLGPPEGLPDFIDVRLPGDWTAPWEGWVSIFATDCVHAAITWLSRCHSLDELLHACVAPGGDVDTVAAIALGAASWSEDYEQRLPLALRERLEDGPFGALYLRDLDDRLLEVLSPTQ
jgi:ADP-ribosylglycohydrolase